MSKTNVKKQILSGRSIGTKIATQEYDRITELVSDGLFLNTADFVREAIREKLRNIDEVTLRDIPLSQKREEIIYYAKTHGIFDAADIGDALNLDIFEVDDIMTDLINEGVLEEIK